MIIKKSTEEGGIHVTVFDRNSASIAFSVHGTTAEELAEHINSLERLRAVGWCLENPVVTEMDGASLVVDCDNDFEAEEMSG